MFLRTPRRAFWLLLALTALSAPPVSVAAGARDADDPDTPSLEQLMEAPVFSTSRFEKRIIDSPSAVTIITAEDIKTYGYRTLAQALSSVRGLYTSYDRTYSYLGMRGFSRPADYNSRFLLLIDGAKVNDAIYGEVPIGPEFPIDLDLVERIEFVPGPGSAVFGSNAYFGVINVITRAPSGRNGAQLGVETGSGGLRAARITGEGAAGSANWLLSLTTSDKAGRDIRFPEFDSPPTPGGVARGLDYERANRVLGKLASGDWTFTGGWSLRMKGIPTAQYGEDFGVAGPSNMDRYQFATGSYQHAITPDLDVSAQVGYWGYRYVGRYVYELPQHYVDTSWTNNQWATGEVRLTSRAVADHTLIAGAEFRRDQLRNEGDDNLVTGRTVNDAGRAAAWGIFAQDEYRLTERWMLNGGLRYDAPSSGTGTCSPRAALFYKPQERTVFKAIYASAFRAPAVEDIAGLSIGKANPALQNEKIDSVELGVEHHVRSDWRVSGNVFHYRTRGLIETEPDPADGISRSINSGPIRVTGLEIEAEHRWKSGGRVRASYTWQRSHDDENNGTRLDNSPEHLLKVNGEYPLWGGARLGLELQAMSSRITSLGGTVGGHAVANVTLSRAALLPGLELSASIYNLFDRRYSDPPTSSSVDALGRVLEGIPQDGRTFRLGLTYRLP